ncbi:retroviral-like aspartic protease family protein, partial [Salmonella enterica]|nr:retroviral-like aspartic protease family protein [Salmonella enterica]
QFMLANGYLDAKDLGAIEYYGDATGGISAGMKVNLKSLTFGGLTIHNVKASVAGTLNAPLLLGQTAIQRLGNVHIDYDKGVIRITKRAAEK